MLFIMPRTDWNEHNWLWVSFSIYMSSSGRIMLICNEKIKMLMLSGQLSKSMEEFDSSDKGVKNAPTRRSIPFWVLFSELSYLPFHKKNLWMVRTEEGHLQFIFTMHFIPMWEGMSRDHSGLSFDQLLTSFIMRLITHLICHVKCRGLHMWVFFNY